jgi:predicted transcriptional regulator
MEVPGVIQGEVVTTIRELATRGWGKQAIARQIGVSINTVRRYLRSPVPAGVQHRPKARRLTDEGCRHAQALFAGPAAGNAVVARRLL